MHVVFSAAQNGSRTCTINGLHLHSSYNPENEAQKFVSTLNTDFTPSCIIVIEPCLSYCAKQLRIFFPNIFLCAIRLLPDFSDKDSEWDKVINFNSNNFSETLFSLLGEEKLCSSFICEWPPIAKALPKESTDVWNAIKKTICKSRDVLATRSFFTQKWTENSFFFSLFVKNTARIIPGCTPVIIAASGPSLKSSLPYLKTQRKTFFLIAVSSALTPLLSYGITPDICITTDGGFWASYHINAPGFNFNNFAATAEASLPGKFLEEKTIIPLTYNDCPESDFLTACRINADYAERNGTVSGTAAIFALSHTTENVYLCGLDLCTAKGFQHTQPNMLDIYNSQFDSRVKPAETRFTSSRFSSVISLEIYRSWFDSLPQNISSRLFRLSDNYKYDFSFISLHDVNWNFYTDNAIKIKNNKNSSKINNINIEKISNEQKPNFNKKKEILLSLLNKNINNNIWKKSLCPLEYILSERANNQIKTDEAKSNLNNSFNNIFKRLRRLSASEKK